MLKFQILSIIILIGCIVFVSCEYAPQVLKPTQMDMGTMDPPDMMDPENNDGRVFCRN